MQGSCSSFTILINAENWLGRIISGGVEVGVTLLHAVISAGRYFLFAGTALARNFQKPSGAWCYANSLPRRRKASIYLFSPGIPTTPSLCSCPHYLTFSWSPRRRETFWNGSESHQRKTVVVPPSRTHHRCRWVCKSVGPLCSVVDLFQTASRTVHSSPTPSSCSAATTMTRCHAASSAALLNFLP